MIGEHIRVSLADQLGTLAKATGDDHLAVLMQGFTNGVERFLHGRIDETAGIDHHGIRSAVAGHDLVALDLQLGKDALGIDQGLGATQ